MYCVIGLGTQDKALFHGSMHVLLETKHANSDSYEDSHKALDAWCMMDLSISIRHILSTFGHLVYTNKKSEPKEYRKMEYYIWMQIMTATRRTFVSTAACDCHSETRWMSPFFLYTFTSKIRHAIGINSLYMICEILMKHDDLIMCSFHTVSHFCSCICTDFTC